MNMVSTTRRTLKRAFPGLAHRVQTRKRFWGDYWFNGEWELRELSRYVDRKRGAIDVGGNIGIYSYHLSRLAKWLIVFEPNPHCAETIRGLGLPHTEIRTMALSNESGEAELRIPIFENREAFGMASIERAAVGDDTAFRTMAIPLATLDSLKISDLGFIKIDVEGHEEAVIGGALETIRANRPALLIEIEERHNPGGLQRIAASLAPLGYGGHFFLNGKRMPLSAFDPAVHQVVGNDLTATHHNRRQLRYINNFLFVPN